jgi:hypothetical protein
MARRVAPLVLALAAALLAACSAQGTCPAVPLLYPDGAAALAAQLFDPSAGALVDLRWLEGGTVLALTSSGHLWRSSNGGLTWTDDTPRLAGAADNRGVAAIVVPERHSGSRVLLVGHYVGSLGTTLLWSTTTSGYTYEQPCVLAGGDARCRHAPALSPTPCDARSRVASPSVRHPPLRRLW